MSYLWNPDYDGITQMYLHIRILMILQVGPPEKKNKENPKTEENPKIEKNQN